MKEGVFVCAFFLLFAFPVFAQEVPLGNGFGVQIRAEHITSDDLDLIKKTGFDTVRIGITWPAVEHAKGRYDWRIYDDFFPRLRERGLKAVVTLGSSNGLYGERVKAPKNQFDMDKVEAAPSSKEAREAFVSFAAEAVRRYKGSDIVWTLWNEPDYGIFWAPAPDVDAYAALADEACRAIKKETPDAIVAGPDLAFVPDGGSKKEDFIVQFLQKPVMHCLDALSLHPYRDGDEAPESVEADYVRLRGLVRKFAPADKKEIPFLSTEWGYSTVWASEAKQGAFAVRAAIVNRMSGVPISIWYEWRSFGWNKKNPEDEFGFFEGRKQKPKSGFGPMVDFWAKVKDLVPEKWIKTDDPAVRVLLAHDARQMPLTLVWRADDQRSKIEHKGEAVEISTMPILLDGNIRFNEE